MIKRAKIKHHVKKNQIAKPKKNQYGRIRKISELRHTTEKEFRVDYFKKFKEMEKDTILKVKNSSRQV
ncbi:hypothetical protein B5X24_HaOG214804 [Helicoverpa armigera]|nr:hypothetical protein B5X24_HaOG214804 [Helicoverpa armigera]